MALRAGGQAPLQNDDALIHMSTYGQRGETPREALTFNRDRARSAANGPAKGRAQQLEWLHPHEVAARLSPRAWRRHGPNGSMAQCPCHEDATPSLSIDLKDDKLLLKCFAGCPQSELMAAFRERGLAVFQPSNAGRPKIDISRNLLALQGRGFKLTPYDYIDADGVLIYQNVRAELFDMSGNRLAKTFRQRRPMTDGKGWIENLNGLEKLPAYRLPGLLTSQDQDIHICEGEKDADTLAALGLLATNINILKRTDLSVFIGRNLVFHEDNDGAGRDKVAKKMDALKPTAASMAVVRYPDAGYKGDVTNWLEQGHTFEELLERIDAAKGTDGNHEQDEPSALEFDHQIEIETRVNALVKGILHPGDLAALYGPSGAGKTFIGIDLAYHIALGMPWHGRRVRQAPVLYVGLEGARGLRHRMAAYRRRMGSAGHFLARLKIHAPLDKSEVGRAGETTIIEHAKALSLKASKQVGVIIIDTLARAIAGDDENSAQDMAAFIGRMSAISRETGAAVLAVHHPGKDDARGMRGSTALFAACDAVIKISGVGANTPREVTTEKVKDGVIGPLFSCTLEQVSLGTDEDGDEITTCIVKVAANSSIPRRARLSQQHQRAYDQLHRLYTDGAARCIDPKLIGLGDIEPRCNPRVATLEDWRSRCMAAGLTATGKASSERSAFHRAVQEIERAGLVGRYGDYVWMLGQTGTAPGTHPQDSREDDQ